MKNFITTLLLTISLPLFANNTCFPQPHKQRPCLNSTAIGIGSALLGIGAGIGIAYAAKNNNHHCSKAKCSKECGGSGLCLCKVDQGECLRFDMSLEVEPGQLVFNSDSPSGTVTPVVYTPKGCCMKGDSTPFEQLGNNLTITFNDSVTICNPECGQYYVILEIVFNTAPFEWEESSPPTIIVYSSKFDKSTFLQQTPILFESPETACFQLFSEFGYATECCILSECGQNNALS